MGREQVRGGPRVANRRTKNDTGDKHTISSLKVPIAGKECRKSLNSPQNPNGVTKANKRAVSSRIQRMGKRDGTLRGISLHDSAAK